MASCNPPYKEKNPGLLWNPERTIHISGILLIVEDKDLIFLLFPVQLCLQLLRNVRL